MTPPLEEIVRRVENLIRWFEASHTINNSGLCVPLNFGPAFGKQADLLRQLLAALKDAQALAEEVNTAVVGSSMDRRARARLASARAAFVERMKT